MHSLRASIRSRSCWCGLLESNDDDSRIARSCTATHSPVRGKVEGMDACSFTSPLCALPAVPEPVGGDADGATRGGARGGDSAGSLDRPERPQRLMPRVSLGALYAKFIGTNEFLFLLTVILFLYQNV